MTRLRFGPAEIVALLGLACIWLLAHRYEGIRHDAWLYAGQALARLDPEAFRADLFFVYGSQDDYSLFSLPYGLLAGSIGVGRAALSLLIAAHLAWALAAFALARRWLAGRALWLGLALVYALPRDYGPGGVFHYAESFLTARSAAEPLVLAALAASLSGRRSLAWLAILTAFLCHPIMALPGALFLAAFDLQPGPRAAAGLVLAAIALALALPAMDAEWLGIVRLTAPYLMLDQWSLADLLQPLVWIGILAVAASEASPVRRALQALLLAALGCAVLSLLGNLTHAAWLIQGQPWRALWLIKPVALLTLAGLFAQRWQRSAADRWLLAGLAAATLTSPLAGGPLALTLALLARCGWRSGRPPALPRWFPAAAGSGLLVVLAETLFELLQHGYSAAERIGAWLAAPAGTSAGNFSGLLLGPLALLLPVGLWLLLRLQARRPAAAGLLAAAAFLGALSGWNHDEPNRPAALFAAHPPQPFPGLVPRGAMVYWQDHFDWSWFLLRRANYASTLQSVGLVFSRRTAMESLRRLRRVAAFGSADARLAAIPSGQFAQEPPTPGGLTELCADPLLDFAILGVRFDGHAPPVWQDHGNPWYLYRCVDFRPRPATARSPPPRLPPPSRAAPSRRLRSVPGPLPA